MKFLIHLLLILTMLSSCQKEDNYLFIKFSDMSGISTETELLLKGYPIGKITELNIDKSEIIGRIKVFEDLEIPVDSKFYLENRDFFGAKEIFIELGNNETLLKSGDTVSLNKTAEIRPEKSPIDGISSKIENFVKGLSDKSKEDSILLELRRLNDNIEELNRNLNKKTSANRVYKQ